MNRDKIKMELKSLRDEISQTLRLGADLSKDDFEVLAINIEGYVQAIREAIEENVQKKNTKTKKT